MAQPIVMWDPAMLRYDLGGNHPMHPLRWELTWELARALGVLDGIEFTAPVPADDATLALVHTPAYIDAVRRGSQPGGSVGPLGHGLATDDNPVWEGMHDAAALIAGGSVQAARAIADGTVRRAINIAGGLHHAMADHAAGFCIYNDAALAIAALLDAGVPRVAYIDVDVHHGDGVQQAFVDDPRVLTMSIHESPMTLWPGTGWSSEIGQGAGAGTSVNIPIPAGATDAVWHRAFHAIVPSVVAAFSPTVLVTQQGADSHVDDPLADLSLTVDGHALTYRTLRALADQHCDGRWLALGGGGYSLVRAVPRSFTHLLATVLDRDIDPATEIPADWIARAARARPPGPVPTVMSDCPPGQVRPVEFQRWTGVNEQPIDRVIDQVRRSVFPLHGLDPFDPRD